VKQGQALIMNPGTWHWGPWPVSERCSILILFKKGTEKNDLPIKPFLFGKKIAVPHLQATENKARPASSLPGGQDASPVAIAPDKVIKLFNGKDLSGWNTWLVDAKREDPRGVYSVRDGMIRISGDGFGYLSTARAYKDYRLVAEVKRGQRNYGKRKGMACDSGMFLHSVGPEGNSYDCGSGQRNNGPDISNGAYRAAIECQVMEGSFGGIILIPGRYADGNNVRCESPCLSPNFVMPTASRAAATIRPARKRLLPAAGSIGSD